MKKNITTKGSRATPWQRARALVLVAVAAAGTAAATTSCERTVNLERPSAQEVSALFDGIPQQGATLGDAAAPVTLTELSDLRCSHCRDFALEALPVLIERYVRPGRLRIVLHNWPVLGDASDRAARVAVAAGMQDRMWQFVDMFFVSQSEGSTEVTDDSLRRVAAAVPGLDVDRVMTDRDAPTVSDAIAETAQKARESRVRGVPFFTIGRTGGPAHELTFQRSGDPDAFVRAIEELLSSEPEAK